MFQRTDCTSRQTVTSKESREIRTRDQVDAKGASGVCSDSARRRPLRRRRCRVVFKSRRLRTPKRIVNVRFSFLAEVGIERNGRMFVDVRTLGGRENDPVRRSNWREMAKRSPGGGWS